MHVNNGRIILPIKAINPRDPIIVSVRQTPLCSLVLCGPKNIIIVDVNRHHTIYKHNNRKSPVRCHVVATTDESPLTDDVETNRRP